MSDVAIKAEGLGKKYYIGARRERHRTLRDSIAGAVVSPFKKARRLLRGQATGAAGLHEELWALRDVSLSIQQGEVVGLIGQNGAGKSTLLKILSRITEPSEGRAQIRGRVGSLLEVGTGFHPELTGRENVLLNGAIIGMGRSEIASKFDEIVAFAEVEKFLETPVKHYSSGMYLKLAFAVAAHLDPEVLLVDEVLAVGDPAFQAKCIGKMGEVAGEGRTVLFVSHNMSAVARLCPRSYCLEGGRLVDAGESEDVISAYLKRTSSQIPSDGFADLRSQERRPIHESELARLEWVRLLNSEGVATSTIREGESARIEIGVDVRRRVASVQVGCALSALGRSGTLLTIPSPEYDEGFDPGQFCFAVDLEPNYLRHGTYSIGLKLSIDGSTRDLLINAFALSVVARASGYGRDVFSRQGGNMGYFAFDYPWEAPRRADPKKERLDG